jgi:spermidine synthase
MPDEGATVDLVPGVLTEYLTEDSGVFVKSTREFERFKSPYQIVEVHDTQSFGKLFRLDGHFMTSEKDEFFYHENLVHVAAMAHPAPETALIVGGGDGGSAEELLKYPTMKAVTLVEIDLAVVDIARKYFSEIHRGAFTDPRLKLNVEDGMVGGGATTETYDLIILDLTDPGGPSEPLYGADFYRACAARLNPTGAMTLHIGSPVAHAERIRTVIANLRATFAVVVPYLTSVPLYGGLWMMACASSTLNPSYLSSLEADRRVATRRIRDLRYYNGDMHRSSFSLPNFVRDLVSPA